MSSFNESIVNTIVTRTATPVILKQFLKEHVLCEWTIEKWISVFGEKMVPFRCISKRSNVEGPLWERSSEIKCMTLKQFLEQVPNSEEWMYFDYKHIKQWFNTDSEIFKQNMWKDFGFPDKMEESTLWIGNEGSHTPAHQDAYGFNIVAHLYGKKRWILYPPETPRFQPTRVPYEESSFYTNISFVSPTNLDVFKDLKGCRSVELNPGDALIVPLGWWHFVQNTTPIAISMNIWIPHEKDDETRITEALTRIIVAQLCKDLPDDTIKQILNPNEDDLVDTPLAGLFMQLETVTTKYLEIRQKSAKRQKTSHDQDLNENIDVDILINKFKNNVEEVPHITDRELTDIIVTNKDNIAQSVLIDTDREKSEEDNRKYMLSKALIESFCDKHVIELVKQKFVDKFKRLNDSTG